MSIKLPNLLTASRIALSPVFLWVFLIDDPTARWVAWGLALFFEGTDIVDGFLARKLQQTSKLGKILDPLADSMSRFTIFLGFLIVSDGDPTNPGSYASVWAVLWIFYRDSLVSFLRVLAASQGVIVSARASGKIKAIVQGFAINSILGLSAMRDLFNIPAEKIVHDANILMWIVAGVTLYSLGDYLLGNRKVLAQLDA